MRADRMAVFASDLGWMCAAWQADMLCELTFGHPSPASAARALRHATGQPSDPERAHLKLIRRLQRFAEQPADDFLDVSLNLDSYTPFQREVVACCRGIAIGKTLTYAQLAEQAGHPRAARAAGTVMSSNRFPLIVPCHRVVGSAGSLGGYSAPNGLDMKRHLLTLEYAELAATFS